MRRVIACILLLDLVAGPFVIEAQEPTTAEAQAAAVVIPAGTPIRVGAVATTSSDSLKEKDIVEFAVLQDVMIEGRVVIREGARATAVVTHQRKSGRGHDGQVALQMSDVTAVDGSTLPLRFAKVPKKGTKGETTADMVIASPFMFYYSPILVPMLAVALPVAALHKGKPKQIPMGERYEVYTAEQGKVIVR